MIGGGDSDGEMRRAALAVAAVMSTVRGLLGIKIPARQGHLFRTRTLKPRIKGDKWHFCDRPRDGPFVFSSGASACSSVPHDDIISSTYMDRFKQGQKEHGKTEGHPHFFQVAFMIGFLWRARQGSNLRPTDSKSGALSN